MRFTRRQQQFGQQLTGIQPRLYSYIMSILPDADAASEVLQRTNLVILQKAHEYPDGSDLTAWACRIAYYEVLGFRRDRARNWSHFNERDLEQIAAAANDRAAHFEHRRRLLNQCIEKLTPDQRDLLLRRYTSGEPVHRLAEQMGRPVGSISQTLYRIRRLVIDCVRRTGAEEAST
ncbi:MAG: sigma-70 family RNA polymerase sigma factor [Planctomycetes bacterium]|nr:sigma-70 family RNA polymerase sigma factor [Planctomycetota bacterium]